MRIFSIFKSISGELGLFYPGSPTIFVRFAGCPLYCSWCFGVVPGRRIPRVMLSRRPNKKLPEICVGDRLMTFDSNMELVETEVVQIHKRQVEEWYRIRIEGRTYYVTEEHPFFTVRGIVLARDLRIGDQILHSSFSEKISFHKRLENPMKHAQTVQKMVRNTDHKASAEKLKETIRQKKAKGLYRSSWASLSSDRKEELRVLISATKKGQGNPNWKGGKNKNCLYLKRLCVEGTLQICKSCGQDRKLLVHHLDQNMENDSFSNLTTICHSCHNKIHSRGYSFWKNNNRRDRKMLSLESECRMLSANGFEVEKIEKINRQDLPPSIRPDPLTVYNLTCSPYNTYLVDYMLVHNCDTSVAIPKNSGQEMSIEEVLQKVDALSHDQIDQVLITGGEPLAQRPAFESLVLALKQREYKIQVETSGVCFPSSEMVVWVDWWVVDYKLPSSGEELKMKLEQFWKFGTRLSIKFPCKDQVDLDYIERLSDPEEILSQYSSQILLSPVAPLTAKELLQWQEQAAQTRPWLRRAMLNVQLHKLVNLVEDQ